MACGIYLIRRDMRRAAQALEAAQRLEDKPGRRQAQPVRLKTTETQRQQWRLGRQRHPRTIIDLMDDIDTLLKRVQARE
jgi:hypothetical protein